MKSYKRTLALAAISILALAAITDAATSSGTGANSHPKAPVAAFKAPSVHQRASQTERASLITMVKFPLPSSATRARPIHK